MNRKGARHKQTISMQTLKSRQYRVRKSRTMQNKWTKTTQVIKFTALLKLEILLCINANDPARDLTTQQSIVLRARYKQGAESANNGKDQECPKEPLFSNTVVGKSDFASASCAENVETF
jgi:hypothetical protein